MQRGNRSERNKETLLEEGNGGEKGVMQSNPLVTFHSDRQSLDTDTRLEARRPLRSEVATCALEAPAQIV